MVQATYKVVYQIWYRIFLLLTFGATYVSNVNRVCFKINGFVSKAKRFGQIN